ncbi:anthranilate synthase component I family protein [Protaetiibacter sp. SSC-01]|uniref:anthranilate synthase component I family protein n=1 Tax=Protaetiibacter sp. SSC-01 TaxID=2759943 RepID=UPI00223C15B1|nr:anthranilate synthase component I family protein [Protaetiibacter sp. SSC-01]
MPPQGEVLATLRSELTTLRVDEPLGAVPLGLVGWFGYELRGETVGMPVAARGPHPDAAFLRVDRLVVVEADGSAELLALGDAWEGELAEWRERTIQVVEERREATRLETTADAGLEPVVSRRVPPAHSSTTSVHWHDTPARYLANIEACRDAIREGEAYQLCLTTEARVEGDFDALDVFDAVRASSATHHGGLLRIGDTTLASASPERFLEVASDGVVRTSPIKGTRPRGVDPADDARLRTELVESEKERAENLMIVDLMRNDLSRVCETGSVAVTGLLEVESYAHVHQLVSTIEGRLRDGLGAVDAVAACFPAGSMTGAPKRRAMDLLERLEARPRGPYAGAFGYLAADGSADLAMTIRTIVLDARGASVGTGGGITALSDPDAELAEARLKAAALLAALGAHPESA